MDNNISIGIERTVLATILYDPNEFNILNNTLTPNDFYKIAHQEIFKIMQFLYDGGFPINEDFLEKYSKKNKHINHEDLIEIYSVNPITDLSKYLQLIKNDALNRELLSLSTQIKRIVHESEDENIDVKKAAILTALNNINPTRNTNRSMIENTHQVVQQIKKTDEQKQTSSNFKTSLNNLNILCPYIELEDVIVIGARPGVGKTAFICNELSNLIQNSEEESLFCTLEMTSEKILRRVASNISQIPENNININDEEKKIFYDALNLLAEKNRIHFYKGSFPSLYELANTTRQALIDNPKIKNVFLDHLEEIKLEQGLREDIALGNIMKEVKALAREFKIRIFVLSQLNRELEKRENKRPILSDLKNSSVIEQVADYVWFLYNDNNYEKIKKTIVTGEVIVAKNRNGMIGTAYMEYNKAIHKFKDIEPIKEVRKITLPNTKPKEPNLKKIKINK